MSNEGITIIAGVVYFGDAPVGYLRRARDGYVLEVGAARRVYELDEFDPEEAKNDAKKIISES